MNTELLDNPLIHSILFHPRRAERGTARDGVHDGTIPVTDEIALGYRLYVHQPDAPLIVFFHGNGEIAADYDGIAPLFHEAGASLLVVDFRGYGWSSGEPSVAGLLSDMDVVYGALPGLLDEHNIGGELLVMGRSLGSICAIQLTHEYPDTFAGLIIESGLAHVIPLLARLGLPTDRFVNIPDPVGNVRKIQEIDLPLLIIHGERDNIVPVANGQALYDASPAEDKTILRVEGAGHNDLLMRARQRYFAAVANFINAHCEGE